MPQVKLLFLAIFLLTLSHSNGQVVLEKSKVTVAGKIENATDRTLSIINLELVGREQINIKINDDGSFHKVFHVFSSHDSYIKYNDDLLTIFLHPGDSLYLTADGENFEKSIQFSGTAASSNNALHKFFEEFSRLALSEGFFKTMHNPDPVAAKKAYREFFGKVDEKIQMIKTDHQTDDETIKWMEAYSKYRLGEELLQNGRRLKLTPHDKFYDFVDEYVNEHSAGDFYCSQYYEDFLSEYYRYTFDKNKELKLSRINERSDFVSKNIFEILSEQETGNAAAELHFMRTLNGFINRGGYQHADSIFNEYTEFFTNESYKTYLRQAIAEKSNEKIYTLDDLMAFDFIGGIFKDIKENHQGKVLYIDFWGTWCSPCLREFPASTALHAELSDEDIAFIYLCSSSKKEDWQKVIQKFELGGNHYLLNDDQYNTIADEFNFTGVPVYMIINKEGVVVNRFAGRPSDKRTRGELISLIKE